ncbi:GntR family transcriptional regulator [Primorskyibacter flagellatus]|uniref:GntR family transcriptional regulator n=1 Tax=Primorskyibacter flagellatus TaxID=1387277 RepID=UPI003A8E2E2C
MEVIDQIEEDIVFGLYPPGSRIVEDALQKRFGLSRYLLRSILGELENRGLVTRVPNRGALVVEPTPDEIDDLYEVREILELRAAERTPFPIPPAGLGQMEELVETHAEAAAARDLRRVFRLNVELHRHQYSFCPNEMLQRVIEEYSRRVHSIRAVKYNDPGHLDVVVAQHREIVEAMRQCDTARYVEAVRVHLPDSSIAYRRAWELKHGRSEQVG